MFIINFIKREKKKVLARDSPNDLSYRNTADTWLSPPSLPFPGLGRAGSCRAARSSGSQNFRPGEGGEQGSVTILANLSFFWLKKQSKRTAMTCPRWQGRRTEDGRAGRASTSSPGSPLSPSLGPHCAATSHPVKRPPWQCFSGDR